jgi:ribosomal protein L22
MSEKPTDEQVPEGEAPAVADSEAKPAEAKKPAAKPAAKKVVAKAVEQDDTSSKEEKSAAASKKPAAKKPAAKKPAAEEKVEKAPAAEKSSASTPEKRTSTKAEKPAATASRDTSSAAPSSARRKVVRAQARYVRTSARKARMVCGHLRGKSVPEARAILAFTSREVARDWSKLLESAVANAENNHELIEDDLLVREAYADEGPTIKRFRPRAQGRATPIRKRTSHLTITLTPKP